MELTDEVDNTYDVLIVGSGIAGLKCCNELIKKHNIPSERITIIEAQDYIGGRVKQDTTFIKGLKIDLGAEILHGKNTKLNEFVSEHSIDVEEIYCWAHGDGGPGESPVNNGYGLYYVRSNNDERLLKFDSTLKDFIETNELLWNLSKLDENKYSDDLTLNDYLAKANIKNDMKLFVNAGFSNTLCSNSDDLSLKQAIRWTRLWDDNEEGDYRFKSSYEVLINYLKSTIKNITLNTIVTHIDYSNDEYVLTTTRNNITNDIKIFKTKAVVVTVSAYIIQSNIINFKPSLPNEVIDAYNCLNFFNVMKILLKFKKRCWPKHLSGMIMSGDNCNIPEVWFRDLEGNKNIDITNEEATCYCVGFAASKYADNLQLYDKNDIINNFLIQLNDIFANVTPEHSYNGIDDEVLPKPVDVFISGLIYDWKNEHPYIGGGYASPKAGKDIYYGKVISKPINNRLFFSGEATNANNPGATAHSALETGIYAAENVAKLLNKSIT